MLPLTKEHLSSKDRILWPKWCPYNHDDRGTTATVTHMTVPLLLFYNPHLIQKHWRKWEENVMKDPGERPCVLMCSNSDILCKMVSNLCVILHLLIDISQKKQKIVKWQWLFCLKNHENGLLKTR